ncbi:MAG: hypothetical protein V4537_10345 [Pseudomonadota bacterium]
MSDALPTNRLIAWLNGLTGWWRAWFVALILLIFLGIYQGLGDLSTWYGNFQRDFWCVPGTVASKLEFTQYSDTPLTVQSCVTFGAIGRAIIKYSWPMLLLPPVVFTAKWIIQGFKKLDQN